MDLNNYDIQTYSGLKEYIKQFLLENKISLSEVKIVLKAIMKDDRKKDILKNLEFKGQFVNSFYIMDAEDLWNTDRIRKYAKIISASSDSPTEVSALCFYDSPYYQFVETECNGFGYFDFNGIWIEQISYDELHDADVIEISEEEYNNALDNFINNLKTTTWKYDHNLFYSKIPSDPDW